MLSGTIWERMYHMTELNYSLKTKSQGWKRPETHLLTPRRGFFFILTRMCIQPAMSELNHVPLWHIHHDICRSWWGGGRICRHGHQVYKGFSVRLVFALCNIQEQEIFCLRTCVFYAFLKDHVNIPGEVLFSPTTRSEWSRGLSSTPGDFGCGAWWGWGLGREGNSAGDNVIETNF